MRRTRRRKRNNITTKLGLLFIILILSLVGCVFGSLLTKPTDEKVLKEFYSSVRPWGFWKPIHNKVIPENPQFKKNMNCKRDLFNVAVGMIWQTSLIALPIYIVIQERLPMFSAIIILVISSFILKRNWYDKLEEGEKNDD